MYLWGVINIQFCTKDRLDVALDVIRKFNVIDSSLVELRSFHLERWKHRLILIICHGRIRLNLWPKRTLFDHFRFCGYGWIWGFNVWGGCVWDGHWMLHLWNHTFVTQWRIINHLINPHRNLLIQTVFHFWFLRADFDISLIQVQPFVCFIFGGLARIINNVLA